MNAKNKQERRRGVLAAGNWVIDHVKVIDAWPAQDALATIEQQAVSNGGCAYNVLKDLSLMKCGFPLSGIGLVGGDADAETIRRECDVRGIDRSGLHQTSAVLTSYTDVMTVASSGRRTFFHHHGANALLGVEHFDLEKSTAQIFYFGYLGLLRRLDMLDSEARTGASRILERASHLGFQTIGDLVSNEACDFPTVVNPSLPHLDFLLLNEYELARLTASPSGGTSSCDFVGLESCAREVLNRGIRRGVVVHFPQGALCVTREDRALFQPSVRLPDELIRGAAGAGDAFGAGFVLGLHEGWHLQQCLELGVSAAAASLRDATCSASVEPLENCLSLSRKYGFDDSLAHILPVPSGNAD